MRFRKLYESGFPDPNEREEFETILNRVSGSKSTTEPHSVLIITTSDENSNEVTGGQIADWYEKSRCIHLTYIIIAENQRKKGIARTLIGNGIPMLIKKIRREHHIEINNVFFESNIPWKTKKENDNFDPEQRLATFSHLGAKWIDIPYVQPALDPRKEKADNMFLLSFPQFNLHGSELECKEISGFLDELYQGLGMDQLDQNKELQAMNSRLAEIQDKRERIRLEQIPFTARMLSDMTEKPSFKFEKATVTIHFMENDVATKEIAHCNYFSSFERDLFNFQNQKNQPIGSAMVCSEVPVTLSFPQNYKYSSEGVSYRMCTERTLVPAYLGLSYSQIYGSGKRIWHLTVKPEANAYFTEYDIIKMVSFFGSSQEENTLTSRIKIIMNNHPYSLEEVIIKLGNNRSKTKLSCLGTGIIQIDTLPLVKSSPGATDDFYGLFLNSNRGKIKNNIKPFAQIICGIVLGIFDFVRMDDDEIYDTIQPVKNDENSMVILCRGNMLNISSGNEIMETVSNNIMVSPYLLIPSLVLAFNDYILSEAKALVDRSLVISGKQSFKDLEKNMKKINKSLNHSYLDDLFHYSSENKIITIGIQQRGLSYLKTNIQERIKELSDIIISKRNNFSLITDSITALLLLQITLWQFFRSLPEILKLPNQNLMMLGGLSMVVISIFIPIIYRKFK